jgi:uncharacterized protein (UPF0332 family)/predicted nucleotidyltransferase
MAMKKKKVTKRVVKQKEIEEVKEKSDSKINLMDDKEIAMDFAIKAYKKFDKIIKSIILFGSTTKKTSTNSSDIDLIFIIDDASIVWDPELIIWYREELGRMLEENKYSKDLHITTTRITTWWNDLMRGDAVILNVIRYGEPLIDVGNMFIPIKSLMQKGLIKVSPEAIYSALQRAPYHLSRSKQLEAGAIEGVFWAMIDSAQAALMSSGIFPPSPEHVSTMLKETFVDTGRIKIHYVLWVKEIYGLHRQLSHGLMSNIEGLELDSWQDKAEEFIGVMTQMVKENIEKGIYKEGNSESKEEQNSKN